MDIKSKIRTIPNFPKQGIQFRDITTLLKDPAGFRYAIDTFVQRYGSIHIDKVVGIESRGFIIGGALAHQLNVGFVPVRKPGKLPGQTDSVEYELEYGKDKIEIHTDAIKPGDIVLIVDDLIATGGTCKAAVNLVEKQGGNVLECAFIVNLPELKGIEKVGKPCYSLVEFEGE
ncbi:MAG: adenine phosphoribosyltransferase [Candidatus Woesearchaeota archaeon]|jgi:adenine phosphoribosyltransferase